MKTPGQQKYYGIIKATTEHWYGFSEYFEHAKSNLGVLIPSVSIVRRYTSDGRITQIEHYGYGKLEYTTEYKFNAENQLIGSLDLDPSGNPIRKSVSIFNKNGLLEEYFSYSDLVNVDFKMIFTYDPKGNELSETIIHNNPDDKLTTFFEYDDNLTKSFTYDKKGKLIGKTMNVYDSIGNMISSKDYNEFCILSKEMTYSYDIHNNELVVEIKIHNDDGRECFQREYEYSYDHLDNWVMAIHRTDNDDYASVCIREIEYDN